MAMGVHKGSDDSAQTSEATPKTGLNGGGTGRSCALCQFPWPTQALRIDKASFIVVARRIFFLIVLWLSAHLSPASRFRVGNCLADYNSSSSSCNSCRMIEIF